MQIEWIKAEDELPKDDDGKVLVKYLEPGFGGYTEEYGIGYYDDPEIYEDDFGKGWLLWFNDNPIWVTHWARLEKEKGWPLNQIEHDKKFGPRKNCFGSVKLSELNI